MFTCMQYNFTLKAEHIECKCNTKADLLSRFQIEKLKMLFSEAEKDPILVTSVIETSMICYSGFKQSPYHQLNLMKCCDRFLSLSGFNPKVYSSHSLQSRTAPAAADHGVPVWLILMLGRWKSDCFKIYNKEIQQ